MPEGTVKFFDESRGFGFIETNEIQEDVFFHVDDIEGAEPREGHSLKFEIENAVRGPRAKNVELL